MVLQRLDKVIASTGRWSRREVKELVRQGRVSVDGVPARSAEEKADPETAEIRVSGEVLTWRRYTWVMLNKPAGYLSATEDGRGAHGAGSAAAGASEAGAFPGGSSGQGHGGAASPDQSGGSGARSAVPQKARRQGVLCAGGWLSDGGGLRPLPPQGCIWTTGLPACRRSWPSCRKAAAGRRISSSGRGSSTRSSG